jgi:hypothetical protein
MSDPHGSAPATPRDDVLTIVGGSFTPASLGPDQYEAIVARARAHAAEYLREFESLFLGAGFDALLQSRLYLPTLLALLEQEEPQAVRELAARLARQYDAVLAFYDAAADRQAILAMVPEETAKMALRMEDRREDLRRILAGEG